ncbi:MAG: alpha/beta hydrolase, partial [Planctomycetota bacterium]
MTPPIKTLGGAQFWTDVTWRDGYRIQQNMALGGFRLLDPRDFRVTSGDRGHCQAQLEQICPESSDVAAPSRVIVLLHGLMRTRHSMKKLKSRLLSSPLSYVDDPLQVIRFGYASSQATMAEHAEALQSVLSQLPRQCRIQFVGHSMGNIVVRRLITRLQDDDPTGILPRCDAMVMLGPPNQGSSIARRLGPTRVFGWITGRAGTELGTAWNELGPQLATPPFPFAIVAGDVSQSPLRNPLV